MNYGFFECKFCNQRYLNEKLFNKHTCELMERDTFVRTKPRGRFAFMIYKHWVAVRKYSTPKRSIFIESRYYNSILNFAEFCHEVMLPDVKDYVEFMVEENILPQMWTNTTLYEQYLLAFDDRIRPMAQAEITFKYLYKLADALECEPVEIFDYINVQELAKLIQCRRFSPWVLLASRRFHLYMEECDPDERCVLDSMVNEDFWKPKIKAWPKSFKKIRAVTKELGL